MFNATHSTCEIYGWCPVENNTLPRYSTGSEDSGWQEQSLQRSALVATLCSLRNWYPDPTCPEVAKLWVVFDRGIDLLVI